MKTILVLRHAQAVHFGNFSDHDRPLTEKGIKDARRIGRCLRGFQPDRIVCSTAIRARCTAEEAKRVAQLASGVETSEHLYDSNVEQHLEIVRKSSLAHQQILLVGHNPALTDLVKMLVRRPVNMQTGALAIISAPLKRWDELLTQRECHLVGLFFPSMLRRNYDPGAD